MKFLSVSLFIIFVFILFSCSTTQTTVGPAEPDAVTVDDVAPDWFNPSIISMADSTTFKGFSLTSAADSVEALELGNQTALSNLRYEIDSLLESVRKELVERNSGSIYQESSFIFQLRNLAQNLDLSDSEITAVFEPDTEDIYYLYTRAEIAKEQIYLQIRQMLSDERFVEGVLSFEF